MQNLNNGNYWTNDVVFSVDQSCTNLNTTTSGTISYVDADADEPGWNPNLQFELQREPWGSSNSWSDVSTRSHSYLVNNEAGTIYSGSFSSQYRYRVVLQNVGVRNTIFMSISGSGLSQISAQFHTSSDTCNTTPPAPTVGCTAV
ncbi:MAG TPA: hypothetical protein VHD84_03595, partial [Candidatus Saccharimonadales bacterium]|nr:hypothetical protein [Candidatus Saccharimonadales bacterium]